MAACREFMGVLYRSEGFILNEFCELTRYLSWQADIHKGALCPVRLFEHSAYLMHTCNNFTTRKWHQELHVRIQRIQKEFNTRGELTNALPSCRGNINDVFAIKDVANLR